MNAVVDNVLAAVERTSQASPAEYVLLWVIAAAVCKQDRIDPFLFSVVSREFARRAPLAPEAWVPW